MVALLNRGRESVDGECASMGMGMNMEGMEEGKEGRGGSICFARKLKQPRLKDRGMEEGPRKEKRRNRREKRGHFFMRESMRRLERVLKRNEFNEARSWDTVHTG